jgi:hypothetical protein
MWNHRIKWNKVKNARPNRLARTGGRVPNVVYLRLRARRAEIARVGLTTRNGATVEAMSHVFEVRRANEEVPNLQGQFQDQMVMFSPIPLLERHTLQILMMLADVAGTIAANHVRLRTGRCTSNITRVWKKTLLKQNLQFVRVQRLNQETRTE